MTHVINFIICISLFVIFDSAEAFALGAGQMSSSVVGLKMGATVARRGKRKRNMRNKQRRDKKKKHDHDHDHEHAHHQHAHTGFTYAAGMSLSSGVGGSSASSGSDSHAGHNHAAGAALTGEQKGFALQDSHAGHNHGASGSTASGEEAGGMTPNFNLMAQYMFTPTYGAGVNMNFNTASGLLDPEAMVIAKFKGSRNMTWNAQVGASAPLSKLSQESGKITTIRVQAGPTYTKKKLSLNIFGTFAYHMYGNQPAEEDHHENEQIMLKLQEEDHDHAAEQNNGAQFDPNVQNNNPQSMNQQFNQQNTMGDDHDDHAAGSANAMVEHDHEDHEDEEHAANPNMGIGGGMNLDYRLGDSYSVGTGIMTERTSSAESAMWLTMADAAKAAYHLGGLTAEGAVTLTNLGESFGIPTDPGFRVGLTYTFD